MPTTIEQTLVHWSQGPFGWPSNATFGQTITVPSGDSVLDEFTFLYESDFSTDGPIVRAEVYAWDGAKATGAGIWESAPRKIVRTSHPTPVTFQTGGIALTAGARYVLFVSISKDYQRNLDEVPEEVHDLSSWAGASASQNGRFALYPAGQMVWLDNQDDWAAWTTQAWESNAPDISDMYFTASFIAPFSCCSLWGLGAASALALIARRIRRS